MGPRVTGRAECAASMLPPMLPPSPSGGDASLWATACPIEAIPRQTATRSCTPDFPTALMHLAPLYQGFPGRHCRRPSTSWPPPAFGSSLPVAKWGIRGTGSSELIQAPRLWISVSRSATERLDVTSDQIRSLCYSVPMKLLAFLIWSKSARADVALGSPRFPERWGTSAQDRIGSFAKGISDFLA